jgi:hypothetical protein
MRDDGEGAAAGGFLGGRHGKPSTQQRNDAEGKLYFGAGPLPDRRGGGGIGQKMRMPRQKMRSRICAIGRRCGPPKTPMILLLIVLFLALPVAGGLAVLSVARRAPEGYEDGRGFHGVATPAGEEPRLDLVAEPVPQDSGVGRTEAVAGANPARTPDLELPFGAC